MKNNLFTDRKRYIIILEFFSPHPFPFVLRIVIGDSILVLLFFIHYLLAY